MSNSLALAPAPRSEAAEQVRAEVREFLAAELAAGTFDMYMLGWLANIDPDEFYYSQHHSEGNFNAQGYSNPEVDRLLDEARVETDTDARKALYDEAATIIADEASYIYLYNPSVIQAWSPKLEGYEVRSDRAIRFREATLAE